MKVRFSRTHDWIGGSKLAKRDDARPGALLAKLWSRFGPPDPSDEGFSYSVHDAITGVSFRAYSGPTGPAYGGERMAADALAALICDFEAFLVDAPLADCRIEIGNDFGWFEIGAKEGVPFERALPLGRPPREARTVDDCIAIARQHGESHVRAMGFGPGSPTFEEMVMTQGFADCLADLVELCDMVIDGAEAEAISLCPGESDITVFYDAGARTHDIPLSDAKIEPKDEAGALWLEAWTTWKAS